MTKEQKLDIERWISLQILKLMKKLSEQPSIMSFEEKATIAEKLSVYSEMAGLLSGTLVVKDDFSGLKPA
jgi:hypothetical protein